jgi:hypothetical protein
MAMENNLETVLRSRPAHVWKDKGELTGLGYITDQMKLEEQLKVRLALKMMRKAYTSGSRFARARYRMVLNHNNFLILSLDAGKRCEKS